MGDAPRTVDDMRREASRLEEELEKKREEFVRSILRRQEGVSAEREKFIRDLKTGSPKIPPS